MSDRLRLSLVRSRTVVSPDREASSAIHEPSVNAFLWRRTLAPEVEHALAAFTATREAFESRILLGANDDVEQAVARLVTARLPSLDLRESLALDLVTLLELHQQLASTAQTSLTFSLVDDDACRRFHTDEIGLRLVCTYAGPGTECAPDAAVDRTAFGQPHASNDMANLAIVPEARAVLHARAGDVVLLKGDAWPDNRGLGAVHRSPPIASRGLRRLVLVVNAPITTPGFAA